MMQMTHICITRRPCVPESQFDRKTSFQTRPNPPGDAQPENPSVATWPVRLGHPPFGGAGGKERGSTGARLSRGACIKTITLLPWPQPPLWGSRPGCRFSGRPRPRSAIQPPPPYSAQAPSPLVLGSLNPCLVIRISTFVIAPCPKNPAKPPHQPRVITPNHA